MGFRMHRAMEMSILIPMRAPGQKLAHCQYSYYHTGREGLQIRMWIKDADEKPAYYDIGAKRQSHARSLPQHNATNPSL